MNVFYNTIVFVKDVERSKRFYRDVIGLRVESEFDSIVFFENRFTIHDGRALLETVFKRKPFGRSAGGRRNLEIYFETDDLAAAYKAVIEADAEVIHPIETQSWGQRVFRFYDPDRHLVEIGEAMHLAHLKPQASRATVSV
jgi:catechol 2,3-dioxygenase-like lactoylglutathione lyase family enzyme